MMMPPIQDAHVHALADKTKLGPRREQDENMSPDELSKLTAFSLVCFFAVRVPSLQQPSVRFPSASQLENV